MASRRLALALCVSALLTAPAGAQEPNPESIEIGLSTDRVSITSDFSGADLTQTKIRKRSRRELAEVAACYLNNSRCGL